MIYTFSKIQSRLLSDDFILFYQNHDVNKQNDDDSNTISSEQIRSNISTSISEAIFWYQQIKPYLKKDMRILEVGAGLGILSAYLSKNKYNIVSIEPGAIGFEQRKSLTVLIKEYLECEYELLDLEVENISNENVGKFEFIYSNNVLEHTNDVSAGLLAMQDCLNDGGSMIHNCPNYSFPYEPHFNIPLVPFFPKLTKYFLSRKILKNDVWISLNFITYKKVIYAAKALKADVTFVSNFLYDTVMRLDTDANFRIRQARVYKIFRILSVLGLIKLLKFFPLRFTTPMIFCWKKKT